ncbi:hypothetical protein ABT373_15025 [Streptomyces sp. NPDC000070]|uniref:hypothetical protein n=1 Tax=Streptomyces sp. NPDC000070 TaxID=3154240 RepID=UPI003319E816
MIRVPDAPTGRLTSTCRHGFGVGRVDLALCRGYEGFAVPVRIHRRRTGDAGLAPRCGWWDEWRLPGREAA